MLTSELAMLLLQSIKTNGDKLIELENGGGQRFSVEDDGGVLFDDVLDRVLIVLGERSEEE